MPNNLSLLKWEQSEKIINDLYYENQFLSPYSNYKFLSIIKNQPNIHSFKEYSKCTFVNYVFEKNGKIIADLPLFVNKKKKSLYLLGHFSSVGHCDIIYHKDLFLKNDFDSLLHELFEIYSGYSFNIDRVSENSKTAVFLSEMDVLPSNKDVCVKINYDNYDSWFSSLSKSTRQNIRTSFNRINREGRSLSFECFIREKPTKKFYKNHIKLFSRRIVEHIKGSKLLRAPMYFLKKNEKMSKALLEPDYCFFSGVYLDKVLIASLSGVISNNSSLIVTRLSINKDFGVYCPGGLLLNETIKKCSTIGIYCIDLSRGNEKYKYTYGGHEHWNFDFIINKY